MNLTGAIMKQNWEQVVELSGDITFQDEKDMLFSNLS